MATVAVYQPSVYDSLPSLLDAATSLKDRDPEVLLKNQIADLFLKHEEYTQNDSDVVGGVVVPRSWTFRNGVLYPFEFGFNESLHDAVYMQLPDKPQFYVELNVLLHEHGMTDLLGLTLNSGYTPPGTVKFEKTFDRANVIFTINNSDEMDAKNAVTAQWVFSGVGDFTVSVKKLACSKGCICTINNK